MESRLVRKDVKKCQVIYHHPDYYLFSGNDLQSCSKQGGPLFTYSEVNTPLHTIAILPDSKLLVHDNKSFYHILDLSTGKVLASQKMPRGVSSTWRFAVSDDGRTAYRIWLKGSKYYLAIISLIDLSYRTCPYKASWSGVRDLICISENKLLVLETQSFNGGARHNQVTSVKIENEGCTTTSMYQWEGNRIGKYFDGRYVWESGYNIRDLHTGECFNLLENSDIQLSPKHVALSHTYYPEYKYLQLIDREQSIFIDCNKRKIIARYFNNPQIHIYRGIYTGQEFWIGRSDGIYASPFPVIEEDSITRRRTV